MNLLRRLFIIMLAFSASVAVQAAVPAGAPAGEESDGYRYYAATPTAKAQLSLSPDQSRVRYEMSLPVAATTKRPLSHSDKSPE